MGCCQLENFSTLSCHGKGRKSRRGTPNSLTKSDVFAASFRVYRSPFPLRLAFPTLSVLHLSCSIKLDTALNLSANRVARFPTPLASSLLILLTMCVSLTPLDDLACQKY